MATETKPTLPLPDQSSSTAMLSSEPSDTGVASLSYQQRYYLANKEAILARTKKRHKEVYEQDTERRKAYYQSHRNEYRKRYQRYKAEKLLANPTSPKPSREDYRQRKLARTKAWTLANPEKYKAMKKAWADANPDRIKAYDKDKAHKRRSSKMDTSTRKERKAMIDWLESWSMKKSVKCYWCLKKHKPSNCHLDHIAPLSKGGSHTLGNVCIACAECNMHKHSKHPSEWNKEIDQPVLMLESV